MGRLGHARVIRTASDHDTNARSRTESQSLRHRARNCSEWSDKLLRVASITASARRSASRFEPNQTQASIAYRAPSVLVSWFLVCPDGDIAIVGVSRILGPMLRPQLTRLGLTPAQYRENWNLPFDYKP
jgi:hypothetical protein